MDIRPRKGAALAHHGAARDCKYVIAGNAPAHFSCAADACDIAAGDGHVFKGKNTDTRFISTGSYGISSRCGNGAISDGEKAFDFNAAAIPSVPDSIPSPGSNSTAVNRNTATCIIGVNLTFGKNGAAVPLSFSARGGNGAAVDSDRG